MSIEERLSRIEETLQILVRRNTSEDQKPVEKQTPVIKQWYTTAEAAPLLGRAEFTVREYCRLGRIHAEKRMTGRGPYREWTISHKEIERYRNEGLLPEELPYRHPR